jgi:hypothetical protein
MNDRLIEAASQFEIPRPILSSSVWPREVSGTGQLVAACGQSGFFGCRMQHRCSCSRYFVVREFQEHGPPLPVGTPSCQHFRPQIL